MPKPKTFLNEGRSKKSQPEPILDTADDYQAAGVELEEAAGKHRAGDVAKSLRFFSKAISTYDEGLSKFPNSFDLAYNKARVQYEIATHPKLIKHLQGSLIDALRTALASHEYALRLKENDADLLFNAAQVLTSLAEELANSEETGEAIRLLQLALDLQDRCLGIQELKYAETLQQQREAQEFFDKNPDDDSAMKDISLPQNDSQASSTSGEEQWASVLEPVTTETLVETILACFATMTTLCTTIVSSGNPSTTENEIFATLEGQATRLTQKSNALQLTNPDTLREIALADTILKSALLDAAFAFTSLSATTYKQNLDSLWSTPSLDLSTDAHTQIAHAETLITLASSVSQSQSQTASPNLIWTALAAAHTSLTSATKSPSLPGLEKPKTQSLLASTSLQQYRLSHPPSSYPPAAANATTLLRNAEVYYRNAAALSAEPDEKARAAFRSEVVKRLRGRAEVVVLAAGGKGSEQERMREGLEEMAGEGLLMEREGEEEKKGAERWFSID